MDYYRKFGKAAASRGLADMFSTNDGPDVQVDAERVETEAPVRVTVTIAGEDVDDVQDALTSARINLRVNHNAQSIIRKLRDAIRSA